MIDEILRSFELIRELFFDGFLALLAVAIAAPMLGILLVLRRMPLVGLAVPQMAGCGQAATYFVFGLVASGGAHGLAEPGAALQVAGSLAGVALGLAVLMLVTRDRRFLGVHAGVAFLVAIGLSEIFYLESPYESAVEQAIQNGRLLTVGAAGRNQVVACSLLVLVASIVAWRRLWVSAFDEDQARLCGLSPRRYVGLTLVLLGVFCALCVPVVGAEVVLAVLLIPLAVLRPFTPSLRAYAPLSICASVVGSVAAFVLACSEGIDWPPGATLVLCLLASSLLVAIFARLMLSGALRPTST